MIRYYAVALALKMFSFSSLTRKIYRFLGNTFGAKIRLRSGLPEHYIQSGLRILNLLEKYDIDKEGSKFLELGTGWIHWDSTVLRLFYDAKFTLFDVWDNRQLKPFKLYFSEFRDVQEERIETSPSKREKVRKLLEAAVSANSFDELYDLMGFEYIVEPTGSLQNLPNESFDTCFSNNVFEHIHRDIVSDYIKAMYCLLKPGGYSFHEIDISDHLSKYDPSADKKQYLKYSDTTWKRFFENDCQYFNRIQRGEWLKLFRQAGFELVEEEALLDPIQTRINQKYKDLDKKDIDCISLSLVHQKPL